MHFKLSRGRGVLVVSMLACAFAVPAAVAAAGATGNKLPAVQPVAAPAVSAWIDGIRRCLRRKPRHCASACTWLRTLFTVFSDAPGNASRQCSTR